MVNWRIEKGVNENILKMQRLFLKLLWGNIASICNCLCLTLHFLFYEKQKQKKEYSTPCAIKLSFYELWWHSPFFQNFWWLQSHFKFFSNSKVIPYFLFIFFNIAIPLFSDIFLTLQNIYLLSRHFATPICKTKRTFCLTGGVFEHVEVLKNVWKDEQSVLGPSMKNSTVIWCSHGLKLNQMVVSRLEQRKPKQPACDTMGGEQEAVF